MSVVVTLRLGDFRVIDFTVDMVLVNVNEYVSVRVSTLVVDIDGVSPDNESVAVFFLLNDGVVVISVVMLRDAVSVPETVSV